MNETDTVISLVDQLCRTRGYRKDKGGPGEGDIAQRVADALRRYPWLTVGVEGVRDENGTALSGFYNVFAFNGDPSQVELLIVGHIDTVAPSHGWTVEEFTVSDGKYYALGAIDTRGSIAAVLDAIGRVGPTRGVGYLFYGDEEVEFLGMHDFVRRHPEVMPRFGLSVCGGKARAYLGWRGCVEMEFLFRGVSGHASRPWQGANAAEAMAYVMGAVRAACAESVTPYKTSANIAAMHAGSADGSVATYKFGEYTAPSVMNVANKISDTGWALLDVRPGGSSIDAAFIERVAGEILGAWNKGRERTVSLQTHVHLEMASYFADRREMDWLFRLFEGVHGGQENPPGESGFVDVTLISQKHGTQFMCLSPAGGNEHGADEWVDLASLEAYRDAIVELLRRFQA